MNDRLQKQARGLLEEIEVGDYAADRRDKNGPPLKVVEIDGKQARIYWGADFRNPSWANLYHLRHLTPQELLDYGIIDEIPNPEYPDDPHESIHKDIGRLISATPVMTPRLHDFIDIAYDHLTSPRPLPQRDRTLSQLVRAGLIYIVHSQNTDDGPVVHYRLTDEGREVVR